MIAEAVIAAAGSDDRARKVLELGAAHGVNYHEKGLVSEAIGFAGEKGVNVMYDNITYPRALPKAFKAIAPDGRLVTAGTHGGSDVLIDFTHPYGNRIFTFRHRGYRRSDVPKFLEPSEMVNIHSPNRESTAAEPDDRRSSAHG